MARDPIMEAYYRNQRPELGPGIVTNADYIGIVRALDEFLNHGAKGDARATGFVVMIFPFGDRSGRCNYISNGADRNDVVKLMKEMITRFEEDNK